MSICVCFIWTLVTGKIWLSQCIDCNPLKNKQHHVQAMLSKFYNSNVHPHERSEPLSMWREGPVTETWVGDSKINLTVCTIKGVYIKSSNAFEVQKKAPSVYTSKTASSSPASVKTDCAAQRKSVKWLGQYMGHMLSVTHRIHWASISEDIWACKSSSPILQGCAVLFSMKSGLYPMISFHLHKLSKST